MTAFRAEPPPWGAFSVPAETENGSFSVSWSNPAYARHSELQKSSDGKTWTDISVAEGVYSKAFSGHPAGRYQFRVRACVISTWCSAYTAPKTALVGPVPTPEGLDSQSKYSYEIRVGDFDGDGRKDVLLDRKSGGSANDGSLDSTILHQKTAGVLTASAPTASELANARTYPLSTHGTSKAGDLNFDGFADRILMGLESEVGVGMNDVAVFAPGEPFVPAPMGVKALDDDYLRFWHEVGEYAKDPEFFKNNTKRTTRPVFQFGVSCGSYYSWFWRVLDFVCVAYPVSVSWETVTDENFHPESRNFAQAMDTFVGDTDYTEAELRNLDDALFAVLGVHSFGFRDDGRVAANGADTWNHLDEGFERLVLAVASVVSVITTEFETGAYEHNFDNDEDKPVICDTTKSTKCTVENVWCWLKKLPAPHADKELPTKEVGDDTNVIVAGPVRHPMVDDQGRVIRNTTQDGHIFHDPANPNGSYVDRTVVQEGNLIKIRSKGTGTGRFGRLNEWAGPLIFAGTDAVIAGAVEVLLMCEDTTPNDGA